MPYALNGSSGVLPDPVHSQICTDEAFSEAFTFSSLASPWQVFKDSFKKAQFDPEAFQIAFNENTLRGPGAPANEILSPGITWTEGSVLEHALKTSLPDEVIANADLPAVQQKIRAGALSSLRYRLEYEAESRFKTLVEDTGSIANTVPSTKWDAASGMTIIEDVMTACSAMHTSIGLMPNVGIMSHEVAIAVVNSPEFQERTKYVQNQVVGPMQSYPYVPDFAGIRWIVPGARTNSSNTATPSLGRIWSSDKVVLMHVPNDAASNPMALAPIRMYYGGATHNSLAFEARNFEHWDPTARTEFWSLSWKWSMDYLVPECIYILDDVLT